MNRTFLPSRQTPRHDKNERLVKAEIRTFKHVKISNMSFLEAWSHCSPKMGPFRSISCEYSSPQKWKSHLPPESTQLKSLELLRKTFPDVCRIGSPNNWFEQGRFSKGVTVLIEKSLGVW